MKIEIKKQVENSSCLGCKHFGSRSCKGEDLMKCIDRSDPDHLVYYVYKDEVGLTKLKVI